MSRPRARLLDISRLVSRAGRVMTGIDRVEFAYLRAVVAQPEPAFAIARTALGYVLLDDDGMKAFAGRLASGALPQPDLVSRLNRHLSPAARIGQTVVRRLAKARARKGRLPDMLKRVANGDFDYINVGHSNLTETMLSAVRRQTGSRIVVMIHDTIPLDYPDMQRPGTVAAFAGKMRRVSSYADQVICVSVAGLKAVSQHMTEMGRVPPMIPAQIGVETPDIENGNAEIAPVRDYFVSVGTIEPRKNHAMLLDIWEAMPADAPALLICGERGWRNESVFARLDRGVPNVHELSGLADTDLAALVKGARALLFPSIAEGFGLPPAEAAALGTPVISSDLPSCREVLGKSAVYLPASDRYQWENEIKRRAETDRSQHVVHYQAPDWDTHFKIVFTVT